MIRRQDALEYHSSGRKGKIEVTPTKPLLSQRDLSLAYSPGVAEPCLEIEKDPDLVFSYTAKGNLVAVVSNGTAVLGLGNIGALAGKPVMEGKGCLFKKFADIDVFDIEIASEDHQPRNTCLRSSLLRNRNTGRCSNGPLSPGRTVCRPSQVRPRIAPASRSGKRDTLCR